MSLSAFTAAVFLAIQKHPHVFIIVWIVALILFERLRQAFPVRPGSAGPRRKLVGIVFGAINHALLSPLLTLPILTWAASLHLWSWPVSVPAWLTLVLTVVVLDLAGYWFHRISHYSQFLWRFHQVHHLDEEMDATTGLRVHFGERFMQAMVATALVAALNLPLAGIIVHALAGYALATFHHSNIRIPDWLERVLASAIITPAFHYPHHHALRRDTDSNYGFIFPWWDQVFGTYNARRRGRDWRMGLEYSPDLDCVSLLREPFRRVPLWRRRRVTLRSTPPAASPVIATSNR
jgi:sterol desaturase/sphingolipid hydroxylase (fatty acid hydroxylase superfamily)